MKFPGVIECIILSGLLAFCSFSIQGQDFPAPNNPPTLVTDHANMLSPEEERQLENKLVRFDDTTSTQIAVVIVNTIGSYDIAGYSFQLAEEWGIGQDGFDNGVLILVALEDRKMFIATGYGVEAFVPDAIAKRIVEGTLKPNFRQQRYYQGLDEATNIIMSLTSGQFSPQQLESDGPSIWPFLLLLLFFIIVLIILSKKNKGGGRRRAIDSRTLMGPYRGRGGWIDFNSGSGTFGGGSGGGFGGFGGGSFGGGGAGGSW